MHPDLPRYKLTVSNNVHTMFSFGRKAWFLHCPLRDLGMWAKLGHLLTSKHFSAFLYSIAAVDHYVKYMGCYCGAAMRHKLYPAQVRLCVEGRFSIQPAHTYTFLGKCYLVWKLGQPAFTITYYFSPYAALLKE